MTKITFLDGGLGQEINKRSSAIKAHPLWSVKVMQDEPEIVINVHKDFLLAGAKVISVNNYTATPVRMRRQNCEHLVEETHKTAIALANQAIEETGIERDTVTIAGCLPPLTASYVAEAALNYQASYDDYCRLIEAQHDGVDTILVETMSNYNEAQAALDALSSFGLPAHIGLTLDDDGANKLRSGESLSDTVSKLAEKGARAVMVNCSSPEAVTMSMPILKESGLRFGAYANGFTSIDALRPGGTVDGLKQRKDLGPNIYANHALSWANFGATIIGGCCEISPSHIATLGDKLLDEGYLLTKFEQ